MDKCTAGHVHRGMCFEELWAIMMVYFEYLLVLEYSILLMQNKPFLIFIYVVRQGGFSSSFLCSGYRTGSNIAVLMPWCAMLINSVNQLRHNTSLICPLGTQDLSWHLLSSPTWDVAQGLQRSAVMLTVHTLRKSSYFGRAWRGIWFTWQAGLLFFIFSNYNLAFYF